GDLVTWSMTGPDGDVRTGATLQDDFGHLIKSLDDQQKVLVQNDLATSGMVATHTVGGGQVTRLVYDGFDRVNQQVEVAASNPRTLSYQYDGLNRVSAVTDGNGTQTSFQFDALERLTQVIHPFGARVRHFADASPRAHDETDAFGTKQTFGYDRAGRLS